MANQKRADKDSGVPRVERMTDAGALLRLARRRRHEMTQDEVAKRGGYKSRHTVMRWEQGMLPGKGTPAARDRWIRILGSYGLHRSEADHILALLNMDTLLDEEWRHLEGSLLLIGPIRLDQDAMSADGTDGDRAISEETYEFGRLIHDTDA